MIKRKRLPPTARAKFRALPEQVSALPGLDALWLFGSYLAYLPSPTSRLPSSDASLYQVLSGFLETDEMSLICLSEAPPALAFRALQEGKLLFCRDPQRVADLGNEFSEPIRRPGA